MPRGSGHRSGASFFGTRAMEPVGRAMTEVLAGFTIAVTCERRRDELAALLERCGARVVRTPAPHRPLLGDDARVRAARPTTRRTPSVDSTPLQRLVDLATTRLIDAVTFPSTPAVTALLHAAGPRADAVLQALRTDVLVGCADQVTAEQLRQHAVPVLIPRQAGAQALADALVEELPRRARTLRVAGSDLVLRGHAAMVDGVLKPLPPAPMAILRALAGSPGKVLLRSELLQALPRGTGEHAVEMAVARLRAALGRAALIQTVVKRGYRLRVD